MIEQARLGSGPTVGLIGLGIMGSAFALNLKKGSFAVAGTDVAPPRLDAFSGIGGRALASPAAVAQQADIILLSLPSTLSLQAVVSGPEGLRGSIVPGTIVAEMSTLSIQAKDECRAALAEKGAIVLDCPVSGTGAQALNRDLDVYASGDEAAVRRARPVLEALSRRVLHVGPFGAGMKFKLVANLLVTVHNVAAAEALLLAKRSGLDLEAVHEALKTGAGGSRMFDLRGRMMIDSRFLPATMRIDNFMKDIELILDLAKESGAPTPLAGTAARLYKRAMALGMGELDTAAAYGVLESEEERLSSDDGTE